MQKFSPGACYLMAAVSLNSSFLLLKVIYHSSTDIYVRGSQHLIPDALSKYGFMMSSTPNYKTHCTFMFLMKVHLSALLVFGSLLCCIGIFSSSVLVVMWK